MTNIAFGTQRISQHTPQHIQALKEAIKSGITMIDTSPTYMDGGAHEAIALAFREFDDDVIDNIEIVTKFGSEIVLNKDNCLPHVSLAMGCIDERDIASIKRLLETIAKESKELIGGLKPTLPLKVTGIRTSINARGECFSLASFSNRRTSINTKGEKVSVFEIEKTKDLQSLHEKVMKKVGSYFSFDVSSDMIYGDEEVAETTLLWIKNYPEKVSYENYFPHITIGYGEIENIPFPIKFKASRLALCHLGNHCTCRKVLVSIDLNRQKTDF